MERLFGRALARDFVDIDAALQSGRYKTETLLRLAEQVDLGFDRRAFADALRQASVLEDDDFAAYGITGGDLDNLRARFEEWRIGILRQIRS